MRLLPLTIVAGGLLLIASPGCAFTSTSMSEAPGGGSRFTDPDARLEVNAANLQDHMMQANSGVGDANFGSVSVVGDTPRPAFEPAAATGVSKAKVDAAIVAYAKFGR